MATTAVLLERFAARVHALGEARFFIDGTGNYGHQASTLFVADRLVRRHGFRGCITFVYGEGDAEAGWTIDKLAALCGEAMVHGGAAVAPGGVRYRFLPFRERNRLPMTRFAMSGGADHHPKIDLARELHADAFLCVQPYRWVAFPSYVSRSGRSPQPLDDAGDGSRFTWLPAFVDAVDQQPHWERYVMRADAAIAADVQVLRQIIDARPDRILVAPIYGMRNPGTSGANGEDILATYVAALLLVLRQIGRSAIVIDCEPSTDIVAAASAIIRGAPCPIELNRYIADSVASGRSGPRAQLADLGKREQSSMARARFFHDEQGANRVRFTDRTSAPEQLPWLYDAGGRILVVKVGALPLAVSAYLFGVATLPPVFEGQASASMAISAGRPYLHVVDANRPEETIYPTLPVPGITTNALDMAQRAAEMLIGASNATHPFQDSVIGLANFVADAASQAPELASTFRAMRDFYKTPGNDRIDRGFARLEAALAAS